MIKIIPLQALQYLASNPLGAVRIFSNLPQKTLYELKAKLYCYDANVVTPDNCDFHLWDIEQVTPILLTVLGKIASSKSSKSSKRGELLLFSSISKAEVESLVMSIDKAMPKAEETALAIAEKRLIERQVCFENKPDSISDQTPYSVIAAKMFQVTKVKKKVRPKYEITYEGTVVRWSGRGRMPIPFAKAINRGSRLDDFLIKTEESNHCHSLSN